MITAKLCIAALALLVGIAIAGDFDDVQSAVQRKDFAGAVKLLQPIAKGWSKVKTEVTIAELMKG